MVELSLGCPNTHRSVVDIGDGPVVLELSSNETRLSFLST